MAVLVLQNEGAPPVEEASLCASRAQDGSCGQWVLVPVETSANVGGSAFPSLSIEDSATILSAALVPLALAWGFSVIRKQLGGF